MGDRENRFVAKLRVLVRHHPDWRLDDLANHVNRSPILVEKVLKRHRIRMHSDGITTELDAFGGMLEKFRELCLQMDLNFREEMGEAMKWRRRQILRGMVKAKLD